MGTRAGAYDAQFTSSKKRTLLFLVCIASSASICKSFAPPRTSSIRYNTHHVGTQTQYTSQLFSSASISMTEEDSVKSSTASLPQLYPIFADTLTSNGYTTPTPIQQSSAMPAKDGENLLLIAATGSGKTLAYQLPALSRACDTPGIRKTVLIVSPTRELAAQLARDASLLLPDDVNDSDGGEVVTPNVLLAVRGIPPPTPSQIAQATVLVGTPNELYAVLTRISGAQNFLAGDTLSGLILDEVDVLLPPKPKALRTTFDGGNGAQQERKKLEQRRKLRAAQRRGVEFHGGSTMKGKSVDKMDLSNSMNSEVLTPTELVLRLIASARYVGEGDEDRPTLQVFAGSATASRTTLDRLNKAMKWAGQEGGVIGSEGLEGVWKGRITICRPEGGSDGPQKSSADGSEEANSASTHTIRAVTVPSVVDHKYVFMPKDQIINSHEVLANVARVTKELKPKSSLVFICGEFSRSLLKDKKKEAPKISGRTSQSRRNSKRRGVFLAKEKTKAGSSKKEASGPEPLSVRKACSVLQSMDVDAQPMHVVLGLEPNAGEGGVMPQDEVENESLNDGEVELPPVLVTFEGSARGLHFDGVDIVFVVGRPTSAASYLHLAGRVGRAMSTDGSTTDSNGEVEVRPGTVVSFCSKGRVKELLKWTAQVGATGLEEIEL